MTKKHQPKILVLFFADPILVAQAAVAMAVDFSPWKNPGGMNTALTTDITLSAPPVHGLPVQVTGQLCNYSGVSVTGPVDVLLTSNNGNVLILNDGPAQ